MSIGLVTLVFIAVLMLYTLMISPANEKRRKRRYLLVLMALYESWPAGESVGDAACQAAAAAVEVAKG